MRELSKCMCKATPGALKELKWVIKFALSTKSCGLKAHLVGNTRNWTLVMCKDSDWAGDEQTRRSVSGHIIFFMGVPILWKSKQQATMSLSSTKSKHIALSEAAK